MWFALSPQLRSLRISLRPSRSEVSRWLASAALLVLVSPVLASPMLRSPALAHPLHGTTTPETPKTLWAPPLGSPLRISTPYDLSNGPYQAGHRGVDLPATPESPVISPTGGTVTFVGTVADRPVVSVRVDGHTIFSLEPVTSEARVGDPVARGAILGRVASGGHCGSRCLHLGVRVDDQYVNPMRFLRARPVLLPW